MTVRATVLLGCQALLCGAAQDAICHGKDVCPNTDQSSEDAYSLNLLQTAFAVGSQPTAHQTLHTAVKQTQQKSMKLAHQLAVAAKSMPRGGATRALLESFQICGQCQTFERFGEAHDGGYLTCMDGLKTGSVKAAYSLGVEQHDQWSQDVVNKLKINVNQLDCTVDGSDCQACKFFKKCVVSADGQHPMAGHESEGWTLAQVLSETSQTNAAEGSLLMKMDIESSEWPIYASERPEVLRKFGELIVEFHGLEDESRHQEYLLGMTHILDAGFKIAHLHGNNYQGMYETNGGKIPRVVEVTFVHGSARPNGCSHDQLYDTKLDAANNPTANELPMAHFK